MKRFWRAVGLVALVTTQACWLQAGGGPARRGFADLETEVTASNVAGLTEAWSTTVGGAPREALVDGTRAFIRTPGEIRALDVRTGATLWSTAGAATIGGDRLPAVVGDTLYVPEVGTACWLTQVDARTGSLVDRQLLSPNPVSGSPDSFSACPAGDALRIGSTVVLHWSYMTVAAYPMCSGSGVLSIGHWGVTAVDVEGGTGGWGIVGPDDPLMCGIREDHLKNEFSSREPGSILITEGSNVREVVCEGGGCPAGWSTPKPSAWSAWNGTPPVVLHNGDVAAALYHGGVVVIDGTTHAVEWLGEAGSSFGHDRPLASDAETIFATTEDGRLVAFPIDGCGAATCAPSWTAALPGPASARPSIGGGVVYVGSEDGSVSAFAADGCGAATCPPLWTGSTPAKVTGAPTIVGGRVIVGSSNGAVTAFALPAPDG